MVMIGKEKKKKKSRDQIAEGKEYLRYARVRVDEFFGIKNGHPKGCLFGA